MCGSKFAPTKTIVVKQAQKIKQDKGEEEKKEYNNIYLSNLIK